MIFYLHCSSQLKIKILNNNATYMKLYFDEFRMIYDTNHFSVLTTLHNLADCRPKPFQTQKHKTDILLPKVIKSFLFL